MNRGNQRRNALGAGRAADRAGVGLHALLADGGGGGNFAFIVAVAQSGQALDCHGAAAGAGQGLVAVLGAGGRFRLGHGKVMAQGGEFLLFRRTAGLADVGLHALGLTAGFGRHSAVVPCVAGGGDDLIPHIRVTDLADVVPYAVFQTGSRLGDSAVVADMLAGGGDLLSLGRAADFAGVCLFALLGAGGGLRHFTLVPGVLAGGGHSLDTGRAAEGAGIGLLPLMDAVGCLRDLAVVPHMVRRLLDTFFLRFSADRAGIGAHAFLGTGRFTGHSAFVPDVVTQGRDALGLGRAAFSAGEGLHAGLILVCLGRDFTIVPGVVDHRHIFGLGCTADGAGAGLSALGRAGRGQGFLPVAPGMFAGGVDRLGAQISAADFAGELLHARLAAGGCSDNGTVVAGVLTSGRDFDDFFLVAAFHGAGVGLFSLLAAGSGLCYSALIPDMLVAHGQDNRFTALPVDFDHRIVVGRLRHGVDVDCALAELGIVTHFELQAGQLAIAKYILAGLPVQLCTAHAVGRIKGRGNKGAVLYVHKLKHFFVKYYGDLHQADARVIVKAYCDIECIAALERVVVGLCHNGRRARRRD